MPNTLLTWQTLGALTAADFKAAFPDLQVECIEAAQKMGEEVGQVLSLMDRDDPLAELTDEPER